MRANEIVIRILAEEPQPAGVPVTKPCVALQCLASGRGEAPMSSGMSVHAALAFAGCDRMRVAASSS
jgi:hypothetical protein